MSPLPGIAAFFCLIAILIGVAILVVNFDERQTVDCGSATLVIEGKQAGLNRGELEALCVKALRR